MRNELPAKNGGTLTVDVIPFAALTVYSLPFIQRFFRILWLGHGDA